MLRSNHGGLVPMETRADPKEIGAAFLAALARPGQDLVVGWRDDKLDARYVPRPGPAASEEKEGPVRTVMEDEGARPWQAEILGSSKPGLHWVACGRYAGVTTLAVSGMVEVLEWERPGIMRDTAFGKTGGRGSVVTVVAPADPINGGRIEALRALAARRPVWVLERLRVGLGSRLREGETDVEVLEIHDGDGRLRRREG